jgi:hypothetical protein
MIRLKKAEFVSYIKNNEFYPLFNEIGWNNHRGDSHLADITVNDVTYTFTAIAERDGFQILTCQVEQIPIASVYKKIDTKLRRYAHDYICIYFIPNTCHHLWVVPVNKVEKRDLVGVEYSNTKQSEFLYEKIDGFSFEPGEHTTIVDVREKVQGVFAVNSEKITKKFYDEFKKQHTTFARFIEGIDDEIDVKDNKNKQWYTSIMLNRLMFCYFIQKKGFLNGDVDYLQHKLHEVQKQEGQDEFFAFYLDFLIQLFHDGLNAPVHDAAFQQKFGCIPYLNGGLFDYHQLERQYQNIRIKDEAFQSLFDFFDKWEWHLDTRVSASGNDINPDVLGYIFEQYINDRAQMGAYYTKEDITEYIGRNTIIPFLLNKVKETSSEKSFAPDGEVWKMLQKSGTTYIYDAAKHGYSTDWKERLPKEISIGLDTTQPDLLQRRSHWNEKTGEEFALPTEIWRETIDRLKRCDEIKSKIETGAIHEVNDFITYNLNLRSFTYDLLANTKDHLLIEHFYHALQEITILDPTCGSGAFLFAAMNILEPLYEICIDRMETFHEQNENLFKEELNEISNKYRSNIQYFIYKSIILRNLYGVDIMVEATEIAKLRLFLKMVAVVEVDKQAENMGLDPLPDIDFNIRCGNTLVGYATEEQLEHSLVEKDIFATVEFRNKVEDEMQKVAKTYKRFKEVQLLQTENLEIFKQAKKDLENRLQKLNNLINHHMFKSETSEDRISYVSWLKSHQPFHWLAEFYDIIQGNRGFDVIIGNPPYVSKNQIDYLSNESFKCSDLYGYVIKRVLQILAPKGIHGFIVMHNLAFSRNFTEVRKLLVKKRGSQWYSFYSRIPSGLFSGNVRVRNCIYILSSEGEKRYTSRLHRWFTVQREILFSSAIQYNSFEYTDVIPMLDSEVVQSIYENKVGSSISILEDRLNGKELYYKKVGYNFLSISNVKPDAFDLNRNPSDQTELGGLKIKRRYYKYIQLLSCGKFYLTKWLTYGDDFHLTGKDIESFVFPFDKISDEDKLKLDALYEEFSKKLPSTIQYKLNAGIKVGTFNTSELWTITDKSDIIFLSYLTDNPLLIHEAIENHIAKCVVTNK